MTAFRWFDLAYLRSCFQEGSPRRPKAAAPAPVKRWAFGGQTVMARTKSEARARLKAAGVPLPAGAAIAPPLP